MIDPHDGAASRRQTPGQQALAQVASRGDELRSRALQKQSEVTGSDDEFAQGVQSEADTFRYRATTFVKENPACSYGLAAALGVLIGWVITQRALMSHRQATD